MHSNITVEEKRDAPLPPPPPPPPPPLHPSSEPSSEVSSSIVVVDESSINGWSSYIPSFFRFVGLWS